MIIQVPLYTSPEAPCIAAGRLVAPHSVEKSARCNGQPAHGNPDQPLARLEGVYGGKLLLY
jgi:hypothetical protein